MIFAITLKMSRNPTEHIESKDSPESKLKIQSICSVEILSILEVIAKTLAESL